MHEKYPKNYIFIGEYCLLTLISNKEQKKANLVDYLWNSCKQKNQDDSKLKKIRQTLL